MLLAFGFGEDGNGELPGKGGYRQERSKLRNPERCFQVSGVLRVSCPGRGDAAAPSLEPWWNMREGGRAQPLKEDIARGHDINWLQPARSKMAD